MRLCLFCFLGIPCVHNPSHTHGIPGAGFWNCIRRSTKSGLIPATRRKGTASLATHAPAQASTRRHGAGHRRGSASPVPTIWVRVESVQSPHRTGLLGRAQGSGTGPLGRRGHDWLDMAAKLAEVGGLLAWGSSAPPPRVPKQAPRCALIPGFHDGWALLSSTRPSQRRPRLSACRPRHSTRTADCPHWVRDGLPRWSPCGG